MKKYSVLAVTVGMLVAAAQASAQDLEATSISYTGSWSNLSLYKKFEKPFWKKHIPKASGGQISTKVTTFDQMGLGGDEVYRLVARDVIEVGSTVADYTVSDAPELGGLDMPMIAPDVNTARKVVEAYRPVIDDIFVKRFNDAKVLAVVPYPSQMVFCNTEISGLKDMEGKQVRASGRTTAEFLEAIGAEGITLNYSEVPGALQRGVVDCAVTGSLSGYNSGWHEVATHLYPLPMGGWDPVITIMNGKKWASLPEKTQDWLVNELQENYEDPVWEAAVEETREGIACLTGEGECNRGEAGNMVLVEATDEDYKQVSRQLEETVLPQWADRVDQKWVDRWNDTIGEVTDLTATKK